MEEKLLQDVEVHELETPMDRTQKSGGQLRKKSKAANAKVSKKSFVDKASAFIDRNFPIDTWLPFFYFKLKEIKLLVEQLQPDLILTTGDPWSSHWIGYKLNKKYNIPWVVDFRDPWTLSNVNLKDRSKLSSILDKRWERRILKKASWATFTSKKTKELYQKAYPFIKKKSSAIYNSYDSLLYSGNEAENISEEIIHSFEDPESLHILFWGQFRKLSPIDPMLKILITIKDRFPDTINQFKIHCFGNLDASNTEKAKAAGVLSNFCIHEPIPPEKALSVLNKADLLLVSTDMARVDIIPAKLWDYLAADPPILSIAPNTEIKEILDKTQSGLQFDIETELDAVVELLHKDIQKKINGEPLSIKRNRENDEIKTFDAKYATKQLTDIFQNILQ